MHYLIFVENYIVVQKLLMLLFCLPLAVFGQKKSLTLNATFENIEEQNKTYIATVVLEKNGVVLSKEVVQDGKYKVKLDTGAVYKIYFSKINHVTKYLLVDTRNIPRNAKSKQTLRVEMSFFLDFDDLDFSFLEKSPISIARFDEQYHKLKWDKEYTKLMNEKIAQLLIKL